MARFFTMPLLGIVFVLLAGCASDGSFNNPFSSSDASAPGTGHFYSEFEGIPVPNEMSESRNDTFITFAPSGIKCGTQRFTGRVEAVSLMNTMRRLMANNGWTLRSFLRAKESILIFEKSDRVASIQISDGLVNTEMRIVVSSRLEGDFGADVTTYSSSPDGQGLVQ